MIANLVRSEINKIKEINWGDIPSNDGNRLLWGENPLPPKEAIIAISNDAQNVNLYPSPTKAKLRERLANYNNVSVDNITITNGSDEAIELIAKVFIDRQDEVIIPIPTFPVYESVSIMMSAKVKKLPLEKNFSLSREKLIKRITPKTKIIWIANPNNPTGNILLTKPQIENLARQCNCLLVIDECYFEIAKVSAVGLIKKYPNIIILRSFSKVFGLAGARIGYILADRMVISYLNRLLFANQVFNVNRFAQTAGIAILENKKKIRRIVENYITLKKTFEMRLSNIGKVKIIPTKTTFSLLDIRKTQLTSSQLKEKLLEKNIYIKDCYMYESLGLNYVYLGIPAKKYQDTIIKSMETILRK